MAAPTGYQQLPLVVAYLYTMAQRWFTAVEGGEEVRVWVIATRLEQTAEVFWAVVKQEDLAGMCLRVKRSGRWDGLGQEKSDAFGLATRHTAFDVVVKALDDIPVLRRLLEVRGLGLVDVLLIQRLRGIYQHNEPS